MRLSTSTCIFFNRPDGTKAAVTEAIERCARAGYTVLDMNFVDASNFTKEFASDLHWEDWINDIGQTAERCGVQFVQAHLPFYNVCQPGADAPRRDILIRRAIDSAARLGVRWAVTHIGTAYGVSKPRQLSLQRNREYFLPLLDYAADRGVGLAFENLWDLNISPLVRYGGTAEEIVEFVGSLDHEGAGVCWDFEHAALMQQDQQAGLELIGNLLVATHVSDYVNVEADHLLPFHGKLDWVDAMTALAQLEYDGDLTFEIHNYTARVPVELIDSALSVSIEVGNLLLSYVAKARAGAAVDQEPILAWG